MYTLHGPQRASAHSDWLISAQQQQQQHSSGNIQPWISSNMQPNGADVCCQQQQQHLRHAAGAGACGNALPADYVQQQRHCSATASPAPNSMPSQLTASTATAATNGFCGNQQQQPLQFTAADQLLGAVMSTIEQELQLEIGNFVGAVVQRHKQQLLKEIQSLSLAAAAAPGVDAQAVAAANAGPCSSSSPAAADVNSRPGSAMAAAAVDAAECRACNCNCHIHAAAAPAAYIAAACNAAAAAAACQQQQQQVTAGHPTLPLGSVGSNEAALISLMSAGAGVAATAAVPAAAPLSSAHSGHSHDSVTLAVTCNTACNNQQQQQQRVSSPASAGDHPSGIEWSLQSKSLVASPAAHAAAAAPAAAPDSSLQQSFAFAAAGGASSSSSPTLCMSMPAPAAAGFAAGATPASTGSQITAAPFSPFAEQCQQASMCQLLNNPAQQQQQYAGAPGQMLPQQQQQQQQPCMGHQQSFSGQSMQCWQLLDVPSLPQNASVQKQQQLQLQLAHSPADASQTGTRSSSGAADTWPLPQQQQLGEADLFASFDAACGDSTEPIAENIFEEIDALLGDDPLNDVLDPVVGLEEQPLLLQASLQQVQQQLQQLEQLQQQQQLQAPYDQLQLDVSSATCSAAAADQQQQLYSPCEQQQQQLTPCSAQLAAPSAVFAQPRPLYRSFSACSGKSTRDRTAAAAGGVAAADLTRFRSQVADQNNKRGRDQDAAAAAAAPVRGLPALKRQSSNKSSSSAGAVSGGAWCGGRQQSVQQPVQQQYWQQRQQPQQQQYWQQQQQQQQAVGVDLMSQLPPWLTRQVSITALLASHSQ